MMTIHAALSVTASGETSAPDISTQRRGPPPARVSATVASRSLPGYKADHGDTQLAARGSTSSRREPETRKARGDQGATPASPAWAVAGVMADLVTALECDEGGFPGAA